MFHRFVFTVHANGVTQILMMFWYHFHRNYVQVVGKIIKHLFHGFLGKS